MTQLNQTFTLHGRWGFAVACLLVFSVSAEYRLPLAGLLVHPYLFMLPLAFVFADFRLFDLPRPVLHSLFAFLIIFSLASLQNTNPFSEPFKVAASLLTFIFFSQTVKSEKDLRWVSTGFVACALVIGVRGFLIGEEGEVSRLSGINALEGLGNKNAQSLYTLPGIFLALLLAEKQFNRGQLIKFGLTVLALFIVVVELFLSANRSGWISLIVILIVYFFYGGLNFRTILLTAILGTFTYIAVVYFARDIFEHKREQTLEGYASDVGRQRLATEAFKVGLESPLFGIGHDELHRQMALRVVGQNKRYPLMDTHILWGYLFGATGIFSLVAFLWFLLALGRKAAPPTTHLRSLRRARLLVVGFVALFIVRAMFTREILYSPTFMGGLGLIYSYYQMQVEHARLAKRPA